MGMLIDGDWYEDEKAALSREVGASGSFVRTESQFRNWITADGSAGPTGEGGYLAEPDRYHLYVAHTCPWAHRALIFLNLKKLSKIISVSYAIPGRHQGGWNFRDDPEFPDCTPDYVNGFEYLHQAYSSSQNKYTGKVTVPTIWDKKTKQVVNNESSEIIRMLNSSFNSYTDSYADYYPEELHSEISSINDIVYNNINNGVYRCGFATSQAAYDESVKLLFNSLDMVETKLNKQPYLTGDKITESDWRLFPTLIRFDACYHGAFKCNLRMLRDYPNITNYTRQLYQMPGISETFNFSYAKKNYYGIEKINPTGIVPVGPYNIEEFYNRPHNR